MNIGTIIQWASNTIPNGWLLCDGSAVSRSTYSDLFSVIGTNFGVGDSSTTFNLPDLRGRIGVGKDSNDTDFDTLGETGGEKKHTLINSELPFLYVVRPADGTTSSGTSSSGIYTYTNDYGTIGGNQAHNILQPYVVVNYIIKATTPDTIKISELNELTTLDSDDLIPVVDISADETKKITYESLLNNINSYSTTEQRIGTWINGKPIYRKVLTGTIENSGWNSIATGISNFEDLINLHTNIGSTEIYANNFYLGEQYECVSRIQKLTNETNLQINLGSGYINSSFKTIIEYTKTTD